MEQTLVIEASLGSGGYGSVHKALWEGRIVAIKKFHISATEAAQDAIQNEIRVLERLRHQYIVEFLGTTYLDGQLVIIMEYVEQGSLKRAIEKQLLGDSWETKTRIARQMAQGLAFMHSQNIYHLDLKSENVLLTADMEIRLCDFGLSTIKTTSASNFQDVSKGTIRWMAPELFGFTPTYSTKADIYALGMIMWEMAANCTKPYKHQRHHGLLVLHIEQGGRETLPAHTPSYYRALVEQCWDATPSNRPSAVDIDRALRRAEAGSTDTDHGLTAEEFLQSGFEWNTLIEPNFPSFSVSPPSSRTVSTITFGDPHSLPCIRPPSIISRKPPSIISHRPPSIVSLPPTPSTLHEVPETYVAALSALAVNAVVEAQVELAAMYEEGKGGVPEDEDKAFLWYHRAANHGHREAQYRLATLYSNGRGCSQTDAEALMWYQKAADQGLAEAYYAIAQFHDQGRGGFARDEHQAFLCLVQAAELEYPPAEYALGLKYQKGWGQEEPDTSTSIATSTIARIRTRLRRTSTSISTSTTMSTTSTMTMPANEVEAISWFWRAAEHGYADAQNALGALLKEGGHHVEQDCPQALEWFLKAANQGHAAAQTNLGKMYWGALGVEKDDREAAKWFREAATQGYAAAQYALGWLYLQGGGVERDETEAVAWFSKAAHQRHPQAELHLGWMYENGIGVPKDPKKAAFWFRRAEQQLSGETQARLEEFGLPVGKITPQFFTSFHH